MNPSGETARSRYYRLICERLGVDPNAPGNFYIDCPSCGKGQKHFCVGILGAFCYHCGYKPYFRDLLAILGGGQAPPRVERAPARRRAPAWLGQAQALAESFAASPGNLAAWRAYKPLPAEVVVARGLGYGVFPGLWHTHGTGTADWVDPHGQGHWLCDHRRLIVPLVSSGSVTGFRVRATECDCPRWLSPSGSRLVLYNGGRIGVPNLENGLGDAPDGVRPAGPVWIVENPIDALLLEVYWGVVAVATLGVSLWRPAWTRVLAAYGSGENVVAYDHDASGNVTDPGVRAAWRESHPGRPMPMCGNKLVGQLGQAGLPATLYPWEPADPIGADIGATFMKKTPSLTAPLARWFVEHILVEYEPGRVWEPADFRGPAMRHASTLLAHYPLADICGCLEAARDGVIGDGYPIHFMIAIESSGEPTLIRQWLEYKANLLGEVVPYYLTGEIEDWRKRTERTYDELIPPAPLPLPAGAELRPEDRKARPARRRKAVAAGALPELHPGSGAPGGREEAGAVPQP